MVVKRNLDLNSMRDLESESGRSGVAVRQRQLRVEEALSDFERGEGSARHAGNSIVSAVLVQLLAIAFVAFLLSLPLFVLGPMLTAHDITEHLSYGKHFAEQFWQGDLYPRWLLNMNHGLGSPSMFIYPPLPSYVYALVSPMTRVFPVNALSVGQYLSLLISGVTAFLWMRTFAGRHVSLIAAILYMLLPYHLAVDYYRRGALSECWALAWMPLVLYFTARLLKKERGAVLGLAISYALLIISHLISVVLFSALPPLFVWAAAERGRRIRTLTSLTAGLALGTVLSAFYMLPALANARYFPLSRTDYLKEDHLRANFLALGKGVLVDGSGESGFIHGVSLATVNTAIFIAVCGGVVLIYGTKKRKKEISLWLIASAVSLFMVSRASVHLWGSLPSLTGAIQFPWRFDILLCIAALPLAAAMLSVGARSMRFRWLMGVIVVLFGTTWLAASALAVKRYSLPAYVESPVNEADGWFDAWTPPGMNEASALQASSGPRARFLVEPCSATVLLWKSRHIDVQTDCEGGGALLVRQFYYPGWRARLVSGGGSLLVQAALPEGTLEVEVPPGRQEIQIAIPLSPAERLGDWITVAGILGSALYGLWNIIRVRFGSLENQPGEATDTNRRNQEGAVPL